MWLTMEGGLMKFFGKGTTTRLIEEPEEKKQKLVQFFSENIHNKVTWVIRLNQKLNPKIWFTLDFQKFN